MKITRKKFRKSGFTLVELLVVVMIIVSLASMGFVVTKNALKSAATAKAKKMSVDLAMAVENFQIDHNGVLPIANPAPNGDTKLKTEGNDLMSILINKEKAPAADRVNQSGKSYFSAAEVTGKSDGLYIQGDEVGLYDPWKNPYYIVLDTDFDDQVIDPSTTDQRSVRKKVIVFSLGPDEKAGTDEDNGDNVYSYK